MGCNESCEFSTVGFEKDDMLNGFVFGGGIETMLTEHVALRAEYLHTLEAKMPIASSLELKQQNGFARTSVIYKF